MDSSIKKTVFGGRVLMVGFGGVAKCLTQLLLRHLNMDYSKLTIVDPVDYRAEAGELLDRGANYKLIEVTQDNMNVILDEHVSSGDLVIDLSVNVGTLSMASWCFDHDVMYINTSVEEWGISINGQSWSEDTLYRRHVMLSEQMARLGRGGPSIVVEHGCNPGLASHWTKQALEDVSRAILRQPVMSAQRRTALEAALDAQDFGMLSMLTGTKAIHVSERDTQQLGRARRPGEFLNTWSPDGFYQESLAIAEIAWGTHEQKLPGDAETYNWGPGNQITIHQRALDVVAKSWIPSGAIEGAVVPHGETFTISQKLTVTANGRTIYRPSVYFVYQASDAAEASLLEYADSGLDSPPNTEVMNNEIVSGADEVGILLLGHDLGGWWTGSRLDIAETRRHVKDQNATTLQVAASALAAILHMIANPRLGFCHVEDLPHREILSIANRYLGECISTPTDWSPSSVPARNLSCQFADFRVSRPLYGAMASGQ